MEKANFPYLSIKFNIGSKYIFLTFFLEIYLVFIKKKIIIPKKEKHKNKLKNSSQLLKKQNILLKQNIKNDLKNKN